MTCRMSTRTPKVRPHILLNLTTNSKQFLTRPLTANGSKNVRHASFDCESPFFGPSSPPRPQTAAVQLRAHGRQKSEPNRRVAIRVDRVNAFPLRLPRQKLYLNRIFLSETCTTKNCNKTPLSKLTIKGINLIKPVINRMRNSTISRNAQWNLQKNHKNRKMHTSFDSDLLGRFVRIKKDLRLNESLEIYNRRKSDKYRGKLRLLNRTVEIEFNKWKERRTIDIVLPSPSIQTPKLTIV